MGLLSKCLFKEKETVPLLDLDKINLKRELEALEKRFKQLEEKYLIEYKNNLELTAKNSKLDFMNKTLFMVMDLQEDTEVLKFNNKLYRITDRTITEKQGCPEMVSLNAIFVDKVKSEVGGEEK